MRLVVDASLLVAEVLRKKGQERLLHPELTLYMAEPTWQEVLHELARRQEVFVAQGKLSAESSARLVRDSLRLAEQSIYVMSERWLEPFKEEALWRVPRDPTDWPSVALAIVLNAGIWTQDQDYFGCGLPTWTTDVLSAYLESLPK
jgi:predicted nucleic acid-binding protein